MKPYGYVYTIRNLVNLKIYVGQTTQSLRKRWNGHKKEANAGSGWAIHRAIRRYGIDAFEFRLESEHGDRASLDKAEMELIARLGALVPGGYNLTEGGGGIKGFKMPQSSRESLSKRSRRPLSEKTKRLISEANSGRVWSEEEKLAASISRMGRVHSPEVKEKIGAAHRGRKQRPEVVAA